MDAILHQLESAITAISDAVWPVFLPFMLIVGAFTSIRTIFMIQKKTTKPAGLKIKNVIGPASISLGAMIGTGAIIGVLGALSKFTASGEVNVEAMAIWALIGACIMVPVSYSETLNSKIMGKAPKEYIGELLHPKLGMVYAVCFVALAVFGFGGFQFSGIDSVSAIVANKFAGIELTLVQRYMFIVVPVIAVVAALVLSKKHEVFMGAMTYMIGTAVAGYFIFFILFVCKTGSYIPTYVSHIVEGMFNPVNGLSGIMLGFVLGMQKVLQTAETGLGALAMAAQEAETEPREAAMISLIPTIVTVFVSIVVTSYIASYGLNAGIIEFPAVASTRLLQYFETAQSVTGIFGLIVLCAFTVLSALTTILGSYYYLTKLFKKNNVNLNIAIYLCLVILAGTLAVFGANVVFEAVDLLLFVLCGINVTALAVFTLKKWKEYQLDGSEEKKKDIAKEELAVEGVTEMNEKLYFNGDIVTLEEELYVEAVLVRDNKIAKVGSKEELLKIASENVELIDLEGKTLMPSFIDAHSHFSGYASSFTQANVSECASFEEIAETIKKFIEKNQVPAGKWIQADGYDQNSLEEKAHPTKELLDAVCPNNPIIIKHKSGHMGSFNTMGLNEMNITLETECPEGGLIEAKDGELTGYVEEAAYFEFVQKLPMVSTEEFMGTLMKAQYAYSSYGVTTVQEGFVVPALAPLYNYLAQANLLKVDLIGYLDISKTQELKEGFASCLNKYNNHLKIGGYKTFLDGSPQGRTAWMKTPYTGEESYCGYAVQKDEHVKASIEMALNDNMQLLVHCNGDAACQQYIDQYRAAKESTGSTNEIRPVIIHAQLLDVDQLDAVKELKMIPSYFVAHTYHWGDAHIKNFGEERAQRISATKSSLDKDILFTFHQDAPVIDPDMIETIWAAVNRTTKNGVLIGADERISALEAVKAVTKNAAYQYFEEDIKGTIKEGKLADMIILDKNILKVEPMDIRNVQVLETIKEGKSIFKRA